MAEKGSSMSQQDPEEQPIPGEAENAELETPLEEQSEVNLDSDISLEIQPEIFLDSETGL